MGNICDRPKIPEGKIFNLEHIIKEEKSNFTKHKDLEISKSSNFQIISPKNPNNNLNLKSDLKQNEKKKEKTKENFLNFMEEDKKNNISGRSSQEKIINKNPKNEIINEIPEEEKFPEKSEKNLIEKSKEKKYQIHIEEDFNDNINNGKNEKLEKNEGKNSRNSSNNQERIKFESSENLNILISEKRSESSDESLESMEEEIESSISFENSKFSISNDESSMHSNEIDSINEEINFSNKILDEINYARKNPKEFSSKILEIGDMLKQNRKFFYLEIITNSGDICTVRLKKGKESFLQGYDYVKNKPKNLKDMLEVENIHINFNNKGNINEDEHNRISMKLKKIKRKIEEKNFETIEINVLSINSLLNPEIALIIFLVNCNNSEEIRKMIFGNDITHINIYNKKFMDNRRMIYFLFSKRK